jgi:hypothetical protein
VFRADVPWPSGSNFRREEPILSQVSVMVWPAAGVLVGLIALVGFVAARRDGRPDLGSVGGSWIAAHRATADGEA